MRSAHLLTIVTLTCLVCLATSGALAGSAIAAKPATLKVGDVIEVTISDLVAVGVDTTKRTRIGKDGSISLPLVGSVKAAGLTESELEKSVSEAYAKDKLIKNAQVSVKNFGPNASTQPAKEPSDKE